MIAHPVQGLLAKPDLLEFDPWDSLGPALQVRQDEAWRGAAAGVAEAGRGGAKLLWAGTEPVEAPGARPLPPVAAVTAGMRRSEWSRGAPL